MLRRRRSVFSLFAVLLAVGIAAGMVRALDESSSEKWERLAQEDLLRMHRDLGDSIALLRASGFEIKGQDVAAWLRNLDKGGYLAPGSTAMRLYRQDLAADHFLVIAHGRWHNALTESTSTGNACARLELTHEPQQPLGFTEVSCPANVEAEVATAVPPPLCPVGGCAEDDNLLARTVLRVQRARWDTPVGSRVRLSPRPVPTRPVGDLRTDSTALRCAPGTRDVGVHAGYVEGRRVFVRLCALPDLPSSGAESSPRSSFYVRGARGQAIVNARVSGAAQALVEAARREGIRLSANSSFRTMRHQRRLCRDDLGCRTGNHTLVAPPGHSQHQLGVAIDFAGTRVTAAGSCERRAEDPTSRVWTFLHRHAGRFGFRQYAAESWHWDALPGPGRCGSRDADHYHPPA